MTDTATAAHPTHTRHVVLALIVGAYMITYMDRVNIASAVPVIQKDLGFSMVTIGWIFASFRWGYAFFQIPGGWLGDRIGGRKALSLVVVWWSIFTSLTAFSWNAISMGVCRFFFGMGEAGAFPIATRSLSRWMLPTERGFAQGLTHAASRVGAALTPALVVMMMLRYGWRAPFFFFGLIGLIWSAVWYWYYRDTPGEHSRISAAERRLIEDSVGISPPHSKSVPWRLILRSPSLWTLSLMYFCYGYAIDVYLDWFPKYLNEHRGFNLTQMGFYASLPLLAGAAGDLLGGTVSDRCAKRFGNLKIARRAVALAGFLLAAVFIVPATLTANSIGFGFVFLRCGFWSGSDGRRVMGNPSGHRRRLCRLGSIGNEHLRQSGKRALPGTAGVSGRNVWVEHAVSGVRSAMRRWRGFEPRNQRRQADCMEFCGAF